jgi:hypothetical protein
MLVLAMTSALCDHLRAVRFDHFDDVPEFHVFSGLALPTLLPPSHAICDAAIIIILSHTQVSYPPRRRLKPCSIQPITSV